MTRMPPPAKDWARVSHGVTTPPTGKSVADLVKWSSTMTIAVVAPPGSATSGPGAYPCAANSLSTTACTFLPWAGTVPPSPAPSFTDMLAPLAMTQDLYFGRSGSALGLVGRFVGDFVEPAPQAASGMMTATSV